MTGSNVRDANWIDGLRGAASFMVVVGHLVTAFAPHLHSPKSFGHDALLFQLPFFRLCVSGRTATAMFFLITGYVNTIGPFSRARSRDAETALLGLGKSVLGRSFRFIIPTSIATFISWVFACGDLYWMTEYVDSTWIRQGYHAPALGLKHAVTSLLKGEVGTWTGLWNENYDGTQWTLILLLQGSMIAYLVTIATIQTVPTARRLILVGLYCYGWLSGSALIIMNVSFGVLMADLQVHHGPKLQKKTPEILSVLLITLGIMCAGYPQDAPEAARWSDAMRALMFSLTPATADLRRYWDSLGASLILLGVVLSPTARALLASRLLNFMGRVSFPVYLLHNQLVKTFLTWLVYLPSFVAWSVAVRGRDRRGQEDVFGLEPLVLVRGSHVQVLAACAVFLYVLYRVAWYWTVIVDPWCAKLVDMGMRAAHGENEVLVGRLVEVEKRRISG